MNKILVISIRILIILIRIIIDLTENSDLFIFNQNSNTTRLFPMQLKQVFKVSQRTESFRYGDKRKSARSLLMQPSRISFPFVHLQIISAFRNASDVLERGSSRFGDPLNIRHYHRPSRRGGFTGSALARKRSGHRMRPSVTALCDIYEQLFNLHSLQQCLYRVATCTQARTAVHSRPT